MVQSGFFSQSGLMRGDIDYHRGVAWTMRAGALQGRDAIGPGPAWFGGLYPLVLGWGSRLLGVSFDGLLSVVSWFSPLALPAALWLLARRVWPERPLGQGVAVFVGTVGSSFAVDSRAEWAASVLPSGANIWPLYPRDAALVLMVVAIALAMGSDRIRSAAGAGVVAGIAICLHGQLGATALAAVWGWYLWRATLVTWRRAARDAAISAVLALGISAWWWAPRLDAWLRYRPLLLSNYPSWGQVGLDPGSLVEALGFVGVLAVVGALGARGRDWSRLGFFLSWVALGVPVIVLTQLAGNPGAATSRRALLLIGIPLVVLAAKGVLVLADRFDPRVTVAFVVIALCIPSTLEVLHMRDYVARRWTASAAGLESDRPDQWAAAFARLRRQADDHGLTAVLAPDADGAVIWSQTGAQPYALSVPGNVKLGLDPAKTTGVGYLRRVRESDRAFSAGMAGLCALARRRDLPFVVVRTERGSVAVYDHQPAAASRVAPAQRDRASLARRLAPGITYRDRNEHEDLLLDEDASIPVGIAGPDIHTVQVQGVWSPVSPEIPRVVLALPDGSRVAGRVSHVGWSRRFTFSTPDGVPPGTRLLALRLVSIERVLGFVPRPEAWPHASVARSGPAAQVLTRGQVCAAASSRA